MFQDLRDSLNLRGVPTFDGDINFGVPAINPESFAGVELFQVSASYGSGGFTTRRNAALRRLGGSGDILWASAGAENLSILMWNSQLSPGPANFNLMVGVIVTRDAISSPVNVFGSLPSSLSFVAGRSAWRLAIAQSALPSARPTPPLTERLPPLTEPRFAQIGSFYARSDGTGNPLHTNVWDDGNIIAGTTLTSVPAELSDVFLFGSRVPAAIVDSVRTALTNTFQTIRIYDLAVGTATAAMPVSESGATGNFITDVKVN